MSGKMTVATLLLGLTICGGAAAEPIRGDRAQTLASLEKADFWDVCLELGRALRGDRKKIDRQWIEALIVRARDFNVSGVDYGDIKRRSLHVGMPECAVAAALGRPDRMNRTHTRAGRHDQWVFEGKRIYVYTDDGVVTAWQE